MAKLFICLPIVGLIQEPQRLSGQPGEYILYDLPVPVRKILLNDITRVTRQYGIV